MTGLFAAQCISVFAHVFEHVAIADLRDLISTAQFFQRLTETDIRHHRRDHRRMRQPIFFHHLQRAHNQNVVAVDDVAVGVHA